MARGRVAGLPLGTQAGRAGARAGRRPKLLLLDEPAGGLNHEEVAELGALIRRIRDERRVTVLLVEHHMSLVMSVSDRVVALDFGRKIAEGTPRRGAAGPGRDRGLSRDRARPEPRCSKVAALCAFYGEAQALFGVDFGVDDGRVRTLLGANGAGKTTCCARCAAWCAPSGEIRFDGKRDRRLGDRGHRAARRRACARGARHVRALTVEENLQLGAMTRRDRAGIAADIERVYGHFPRLKERRAQQAGTLPAASSRCWRSAGR